VRDYALQQEGNEREEEREEKRLLWEVRTLPIPIIFRNARDILTFSLVSVIDHRIKIPHLSSF